MNQYFAFGSNMNPARLRQRVGDFPTPCPSVLLGYRLVFNKKADRKPGVGFANIVISNSDQVHGLLYELTNEQLEMLSAWEGVSGSHYYRTMLQVLTDGGESVRAVAYVACEDKIAHDLLPEAEYLNHLLAAREHLPPDYVVALEKQAVRQP